MSGKPEQPNSSPSTSTPSLRRASGSKRRWREPKSIKEFASQVNAVSTLLLNDGIDLEKAKAYSNLARTIAQAMTAELGVARMMKTKPDLSLKGLAEEDEE